MVAEFRKPLTDEVVQAADFVITTGAKTPGRSIPGARYMDWPATPSGNPSRTVRHIRDDIAARLKAVCHEMDVTLA